MTHEQTDYAQRIAELEAELEQLRTRQQHKDRALNLLYRLSLVGRGYTVLPDFLTAISHELRTEFPLDTCVLAVCDPEQPLVFSMALMATTAQIELVEHVHADALTRQLLHLQAPLLLHDLLTAGIAERPMNALAEQTRLVQPGIRSWLGVPVFNERAVLGIIILQDTQPGRYAEQDQELLQQVSSIMAITLENIRLTGHQRQLTAAMVKHSADRSLELATLSALAAELVLARPLPDLLDQALALIVNLLKIQGGAIHLLQPPGHVPLNPLQHNLVPVAQRGFPAEYGQCTRNVPVAYAMTGQVLLQNRPLILRREQHRPSADDLPFESILALPLHIRGRMLGTLSLVHSRWQEFDQEQIDLAQAIGNQIAIAIENANLLDERERQIAELQKHTEDAHRRAHEMELVFRIASVLSSRIDQQEILDLAGRELVTLFWADHTGTVLFNDDLRYGVVVAEYPPGQALGIEIPLTDNRLVDELATTRQPVMIASIETDPRAATSRETFRHLGIVSLIVVPLISRDRLIGSISLDSFTPRVFSADEQHLLLTIATSIATAVENARLFAAAQEHVRVSERHAQRMELVNRMALVLSNHLDLQEIANLAAREVVHLFWTDHAALLLLDDDQEWGTVVSEYPPGNFLGMRFPVASVPVIQEVIATRRPIYIQSIATDDRVVPLRAELQVRGTIALLSVPLVSRGRVIGVMGLDGSHTAFTAEEQEVFLTVAASIAAAVETARLFAAEQSARRTADTLREVARVLSSSFDPAEVLDLILRELQHVVSYDTASIMLVAGPMLRIAACRGWEAESSPRGVSFPIAESAAGQVVRLARPIVTYDVQSDPAWTNRTIGAHIRSWLGVPLSFKGVVLGVLNIDACQPGRFDERDAEVAQAFANQAAVALENARLYQESVTRVEQEMAIARRIQSNLFPGALPYVVGLTLAAHCVPARETGGDFYDFVDLGDQRLALMVGDVSGKSIPAAMLMAVARSITRSEAHDHQLPEVVVDETNRWIVRDIPRHTFIALVYATFDLKRRVLALANAGQLMPLRRRSDGRVEHLEPAGPHLPLGVMPGVRYEALELPLEPGDLLVFHTDGIVETHNSDQELFGFERFETLLREYGDLEPHLFIERVMQVVRDFAGTVPQHDDITLVVVRVE